MNIVCAQCNTTYTLPDQKVPAKQAVANCKKCGGRIVIEPGSSRSDSDSPEVGIDGSRANPAAEITGGGDKGRPAGLVEDYPDLAEFSPSTYRFDDMFARNKKGGFKSLRNSFKTKILKSVKPMLDRMLTEGECVLRIAFGTAYYPLEIFLGNGWLTMLYNRYALVATNHRLIMINTNHRMTKPSHYLFQMPYEEIKQVKRGLFRSNIVLERKQGKRRVFTAMKRYLSAEMHQFIQDRIDPEMALQEDTPLKEHLCPACFEALPAKLDECSHCAAAFKTPKKAMIRSLILPGLGDIYLGHRVLGILELTGSLMVWSIVIALLATGEIATAVFLLLICNGVDTLLTRYMARKGYILEKRQDRMSLQAVQSPA